MDEKKKLNSAGFCAVLGLLILAAGFGGYALLQGRELPPPVKEETEVTDQVRQPAAAPRPSAPPASAPARVELPEAPAVKTVETAAPVIPEKPELPEEPGLVIYPVSGTVAAAFSASELQYSETLGDWRTHDGIDLEAAQGTAVLAASAGTVISVEDDPLMGTTVRIDHVGGYRTTYANLQSKPPVTAGDEVSAGQIIGAVGETAIAECRQPPHLHFGVEKDEDWMDPEIFLNP